MENIQIKTHRPSNRYSDHTLFILSKGNNAGKPLTHPCPNCFAVTVESHEQEQMLRWICYSLWQSGIFRRYLIGSVIEFIRIADVKSCMERALCQAKLDHNAFTKSIQALELIRQHETNLRNQLKQLEFLKVEMSRNIYRTS